MIEQQTEGKSSENESSEKRTELRPFGEGSRNLATSTTSLELKEFRHPGDDEPEMSSFLPQIEQPLSQLSSQFNKLSHALGSLKMLDDQIVSITTDNSSDPNLTSENSHTRESSSDKPLINDKKKAQVQKRLMGYVKRMPCLLYIALIAAMASGSILPASSVLIARMMQTLALLDASTFRHDSNVLSLCLLMLECAGLIFQPIEKGIYALIGEQVTSGIRSVFDKLLQMHMGFFDNPLNSAGMLASKLASNTIQVNSLVTTVYGQIVAGTDALITGVYLSEVLNKMRTVASFAKEAMCLKLYANKLEEPLRENEKKSVLSGAGFGFSEFARFLL